MQYPASKSEEVTSQIAVITREEILARLNDPSLLLVNVMPKETFEDGHIPRSINLPLSEVETKARQLFRRHRTGAGDLLWRSYVTSRQAGGQPAGGHGL